MTCRSIRSGDSRLGALLGLLALLVAMFVSTESPALAVAYSYSFNNGGGGNTPFGGSQEEGTAINWGASCKGPGTSRPGYTLLGFRSSHDGLVYGTDCGGGYFSLTGYTMPSQNVVFTFVWTLDITYDSQGGSAIADGDTTTTNGATITTLPTDPTRTGYTFAGWYTSSSGGTQITTGAPHGQTSHFTLYAKWTGNPLVISYDSQGGSAVVDGDTTSAVGGLINPLPTPPTRSGFSFTGWNTSADGTGVDVGFIVLPGSDGPAHGQSADFTLYAQWLGDTLNITYDSQSGSAVVNGDTTTSSGATITTLPTDPTRAGYTFAGWYTASSGGTLITTGAPHGQTSDFTLYAQWSPVVVPIAPAPVLTPVWRATLDPNGGVCLDSVARTEMWTSVFIGHRYLPNSSDCTRDGHHFAGWATADELTTIATFPLLVDPSDGEQRAFLAANANLVAIWTSNTDEGLIAPAPSVTARSRFTINMGGAVSTVEHRSERITTNMNAAAGTLFSIIGTQYQHDSDIEVWINSTRVLLGTTRVGVDNTFIIATNLPSDIQTGEHTLEIVGVDLAGEEQTTWIGLFVETPNFELPITGRNSDLVLSWSLALLVAGVLVGVFGRRRGLHR